MENKIIFLRTIPLNFNFGKESQTFLWILVLQQYKSTEYNTNKNKVFITSERQGQDTIYVG